jgi:hypothetical protein
MRIDILENLRHLAAAPGVGFEEVSSGLLVLVILLAKRRRA